MWAKCHSYTDGILAIGQHRNCPRSTCTGDWSSPNILPKPIHLLIHLFESCVALSICFRCHIQGGVESSFIQGIVASSFISLSADPHYSQPQFLATPVSRPPFLLSLQLPPQLMLALLFAPLDQSACRTPSLEADVVHSVIRPSDEALDGDTLPHSSSGHKKPISQGSA